MNVSLGNFWSLQHAQLYSEPERLAEAGYLKERREEGGRRRRHYSITKKGRDALAEWRDSPAERIFELRDLGPAQALLRRRPRGGGRGQLEMYRRKLAEYEGAQAASTSARSRAGPG